MVNFVLDYLNSNVKMDLSGVLPQDPVPIDASAVAVLFVDVEQMKLLFQYQTDSVDFDNSPESDLKFYIDTGYLPELNVANARLDTPSSSGAIAIMDRNMNLFPSQKMFLGHDYIRYLALSLFGTHHGVDLFHNEREMLQDLRTLMGYAEEGQLWYDLRQKLYYRSKYGTHPELSGEYGFKYMTNTVLGTDNMCRIILETLLTMVPHRFQQIEHTDGFQRIPFEPGDYISFKVTMVAAEDQELVTGVEPIGNRSYEIRLIMVEPPAENMEPSPEEL
jgi:hypothetical protein